MRAASPPSIGVVLALALGLVLGGCASEDEPVGQAPAATTDAAATDVIGGDISFAEIERLTEDLVDLHGDPEAFARLWWTLDRGYTFTQLVERGGVAVASDGTVTDIEPAGPSLGLLSEPPVALPEASPHEPATGVLVVASTAAATPAQRQVIEDLGANLRETYERARGELARDFTRDQTLGITTLSAGLLARGYSPEQVVEAIILRTVQVAVDDDMDVRPCGVSIRGEEPARSGPLSDICGPPPVADAVDETVDSTDSAGPESSDADAAPPVEDGTFRGEVPESYFTFLSDPGNPATLAINQVTVDVLSGQAAATVRWEVDGFSIDVECTSDRVQVIESVAAVGFVDGVALLPATSSVSEQFTGSGCPDLPTSAESPSQIRLTGDGPDGLLLEVLDSSGDVTISVPLARS